MKAHSRRRIWLAAVVLWNTAGSYVTYILRNELWWVQVMSHAAITISLWTGWAAETPVEQEPGSS